MFVELQHPNSRDAMYANHTRMTVDALVMNFEFDRASAEAAVSSIWAQFAEAPGSTRDRLVHEDPVNLATEIAKKHWTDLEKAAFADRLKAYNASVRPASVPR